MEAQAQASPEITKVANFLRTGNAGMKMRVGALNGKRIDYFKGKSAIKALLSPAYAKQKNVPKVTTEEEATKLLTDILKSSFVLRVNRGGASGGSGSPKLLQQIGGEAAHQMASDGYYAWLYEGSQWTTYAGGVLMVVLMLGGVMFPLWPPIMRLGVWYLSIGMLGLIGLFFAIAIVRLIFYVITIIVAPPGIWVFPQLFADVGFVESFIPLWEWDIPKKKSKKKKGEKKSKKDKNGTATPDGEGEAEESGDGDSRPHSRSARVEEVEDEDD